MKLAAAAPAILELFRADQITTDQVIALCSTDDHALQVAVWERNGKPNSYSSSPAQLRRAVLESEITADDARVAFIGGVEVYKAAGGTIRADLFGGVDGAVILTDAALVGHGRSQARKGYAYAHATLHDGDGSEQISDFQCFHSYCGLVQPN